MKLRNKKMRIAIYGCDDTTYIDEEDWGEKFTDSEIKTLKKLEKLSHEFSYCQCQPVLEIEEEE